MAYRVTLHSCVAQQVIEELRTLLNQKVADIDGLDEKEQTALHCAVLDQWEAGVNLLLERGANVEAKDESGNTPLHNACSVHHLDIVDLLLDFGADVNVINYAGQTPLHVSSRSPNVHLAKVLLRRGAKINHQDKTGNSPLLEFCLSENEDEIMLELLFKNGAEIELKNESGMTPFLIACKTNNIKLVKELLLSKADVNSKNVHGNTALHLASCLESAELVKLLLSKGSKLESRNKLNQTPLLYAVRYLYQHYLKRYSHDEDDKANELAVFYLIQKEADVNVKGIDETTPLYIAASMDNLVLVKKLLIKGAQVDVKNRKKNTPLHCACRTFQKEVVKELLFYGAEVNARNKRKETPLHIASRFGYEEIINMLLGEGADVNLRDKDGNTPMLLFCHKRPNGRHDVSSVSVFLEYGAEVNVYNKKLDTPLIYAALHQNETVVGELLMKGADYNAKSKFGDTPLHLACRRNNLDSIELLLNKGANVNVTNNKGDTPLHASAESSSCCRRIIELLLERNPDVNHKNMKGETVLHLTTPYFSIKAIKLLLIAGCNVNEVDNNGNTPLHSFFGDCNNDRIFSELLAWGASVQVLNKDRISPLGFISKGIYKFYLGQAVKKHIVLSKVASLPLESPLDVSLYIGFDSLSDFQAACLMEVDRMKARKFDVHSIFHILSKYRDPTYLSNRELVYAVESLTQQPTEFPIYSSVLLVTYRRAKQRIALMNKAQSLLPLPFPNEILRKTLAYLDDKYLMILIASSGEE